MAQLPLFVSDGKWHHVCITWTTRDGLWEAFQDGEKLGSGENLAPWHPIKPGGVLVLGQEQVGAFFRIPQFLHPSQLGPRVRGPNISKFQGPPLGAALTWGAGLSSFCHGCWLGVWTLSSVGYMPSFGGYWSWGDKRESGVTHSCSPVISRC